MKAVFLCLCLMAGAVVSFAQGTPPLTVREVDNSPRKSGINTLVFPNGSVTLNGSTATITSGVSGLTSTETLITSSVNFRVPGSGGSASETNLQFGAANIGFYNSGSLFIISSQNIPNMAWSGFTGNTIVNGSYQLAFGSSGLTSPDVGLARSSASVLKLSDASSGFGTLHSGGVRLEGVLEANLGSPSNGTVVYCSDCTIANPCASGGTGALAKRLNGVWVCN
jgi:hypothetical protein